MIRNSKQVLKLVMSVGFVTGIAAAGVWFLNNSSASTGICGKRVQNYNYDVPFGNAVWNQPVCDLPRHPKSADYADRMYNWSFINPVELNQDRRKNLGDDFEYGPNFASTEAEIRKSYGRNVYLASDATTTTKIHAYKYSSNLDEDPPYDPSPTGKRKSPDTPIPWNPAWKTGKGGDNEIVILDESNGRIYEISNYWPDQVDAFTKCGVFGGPGTGRICTGTTRIGRDSADNIIDYRTFEGAFGDRGMGLSKFITFTMPEEILAGEIRHAMGIAIPNTAIGPVCNSQQVGTSAEGETCGTAVAPATKVEHGDKTDLAHVINQAVYPQTFAQYTQDKLIPEGMRFAIDITDAEISAWIQSRDDLRNNARLAETARIVAVALRDYGMIVADTGGGGPGIQVAGTENPDSKTKWQQLGFTKNTKDKFLKGLVTEENLYVVEPPTVTCEDGSQTKYYCTWTEASYGDDGPPPADTTKPNISINEPANNSTVSGLVSINTVATDNVAVAKVEFFVDGKLEGTASTAPYKFNLATTSLSNGLHTIEAKAHDSAGNVKSDSITITINNVITPEFPADFNKDGSVTIVDLAILLSGYGNDVTAYTNGDCNGDGQVTLQDLAILLSEYGKSQ